MRKIISSLFLLIASSVSLASSAQGDPLTDATCKVYFKPGMCSVNSVADIGKVERVYLYSDGKTDVTIQVGNHLATLTQGKEKPVLGDPEKIHAVLQKSFPGKTPDAVSINCVDERKTCGIAEPKAAPDCCTPKHIAETEKVGELSHLEGHEIKASCTLEEKKKTAIQNCWSANALTSGAGKCLANALWGILKPVIDMGEFIYDISSWLLVQASKPVDWITQTHFSTRVKETLNAPVKYIEDWWAGTKSSEDRSSEMMRMAAHAPAKEIKLTKASLGQKKIDGPAELPPSVLKRFENFISGMITDNFGCQKWSGIPHAPKSTCLIPWKGLECADCWARANMSCGVIGVIYGQIPAGKLFASFLKYFTLGVEPVLEISGKGADAIQSQLSKMTKLVVHPSEFSYFEAASSTVVKVAAKTGELLEKGTKIASDALMAPIRVSARFIENRLPPEIVGKITSMILRTPSEAARLFYRKLQLEVAESSGGEAKVLAVSRQQALEELHEAERDLTLAKNAEHQWPDLVKTFPDPDLKAVDFGVSDVSKIEAAKMPSGQITHRAEIAREGKELPQVRYRGLETVDDVKAAIATHKEKIITLGGTSGAGYQEPEKVMSMIRQELEKIPAKQRKNYYVNIGATDVGIGKAYQVAKELGFKTSGIVSSQAAGGLTLAQTKYVDKIVFVEDAAWGGFANGAKTGSLADLTPTSRAMVGVSDRLFYVGGQDVSGAELEVAREENIRADFIAADLNHDIALQKAQKAGKAAPTSFNGTVDGFIHDVPNGTATHAPHLTDQEEHLLPPNKEPKRISSPAVRYAENRIANANKNIALATQRLDVMDLKNLPEEFSKMEVQKEIATAKKLGEKLTKEKVEQISTQAKLAGEQEQAKNLQIAYKGVELINQAPLAQAEEIEKSLAPALHDSWQASRVATPEQVNQWITEQKRVVDQMPLPERELFEKIEQNVASGNIPAHLPRIKPLASSKFGQATGAVDIANTRYEDLPAFWQVDNQKAAQNIVTALFSQKSADGKIVSKIFDKISSCNGCVEHLDQIAKTYQKIASSASAAVEKDPLMISAAREFNKWKERTGTSYTHELELGLIFETSEEINEKREYAEKIKEGVTIESRASSTGKGHRGSEKHE